MDFAVFKGNFLGNFSLLIGRFTHMSNLNVFWSWFNGAPLHIVVIIVAAIVTQQVGRPTIPRILYRISHPDLVAGPKTLAHSQSELARH